MTRSEDKHTITLEVSGGKITICKTGTTQIQMANHYDDECYMDFSSDELKALIKDLNGVLKLKTITP
jgi:hypothetical protein